jgi:alkylation response protein AidB-like acyl-CoA dehydrogenase
MLSAGESKVPSHQFSWDEVSKHNSEKSCWVVVDNVVYDVTRFLSSHPGGRGVLLKLGGKDVTSDFYDFHAKDILEKYTEKLKIGTIRDTKITSPSLEDRCKFDTVTPFGESTAFRGWKSPYFQERHQRTKLAVREFLHKQILPLCGHCEETTEDVPHEAFKILGSAGILAARMGPAARPFVKKLNLKLPGGISADELDYFTRYVTNYEFYANLPPGLSDGLSGGINIGLPPIMYFGNEEQKQKYVPDILMGEKRVCLAITEASGGSDVAGLKTTAQLSECGKYYIVNGVKRWITSGNCADVFVTACRTGKAGHNGLSFFIIDRSEGLTTTKMKTSYSGAASTAVVIYENVKVPVENLLGPENHAFKMIMANFNQERWLIVHSFLGPVRNVVADCYRWAMQRKAFGKRLIDQPVIRYKLAEMSAATESLEAWCESITYQMEKMSFMEQTVKLAAPIALLKFHTTRTCVMIADNACQIFGGRSVTKTGMGKRVEAFMRCYKIPAIYGGSEEIMADVAVRQEVGRLEARLKKGDRNAIVMSRL